MSKRKLAIVAGGIALALSIGVTSTVSLGQMAPFGNPEDTSYAETLWQSMLDANMAGDDAIRSFPYE
ncbi:MAG: hypothetical protein COA52_18820, partial [Hyphomicrobiales bacterium]